MIYFENAGSPAGDVDWPVEIQQDQIDDLAEAERDDGKVVAAQPKHRNAEQHAGHRGDCGGQRERRDEGEMDAEVLGRDHRIGVGT